MSRCDALQALDQADDCSRLAEKRLNLNLNFNLDLGDVFVIARHPDGVQPQAFGKARVIAGQVASRAPRAGLLPLHPRAIPGGRGELRHDIEARCGRVVAMASIGAAQFSANIALTAQTKAVDGRVLADAGQSVREKDALYQTDLFGDPVPAAAAGRSENQSAQVRTLHHPP